MATVKGFNAWMASIAIMFTIGGLGLGYFLGHSGQTSSGKINNCLYASLSAYPNWEGPGLLLDNLSACKGLSEASKDQLRTLTSNFMTTALTK